MSLPSPILGVGGEYAPLGTPIHPDCRSTWMISPPRWLVHPDGKTANPFVFFKQPSLPMTTSSENPFFSDTSQPQGPPDTFIPPPALEIMMRTAVASGGLTAPETLAAPENSRVSARDTSPAASWSFCLSFSQSRPSVLASVATSGNGTSSSPARFRCGPAHYQTSGSATEGPG